MDNEAIKDTLRVVQTRLAASRSAAGDSENPLAQAVDGLFRLVQALVETVEHLRVDLNSLDAEVGQVSNEADDAKDNSKGVAEDLSALLSRVDDMEDELKSLRSDVYELK